MNTRGLKRIAAPTVSHFLKKLIELKVILLH